MKYRPEDFAFDPKALPEGVTMWEMAAAPGPWRSHADTDPLAHMLCFLERRGELAGKDPADFFAFECARLRRELAKALEREANPLCIFIPAE